MLMTRFFHAATAAFRAFHASLLSPAAGRPASQPRPVWDDGTDYDTPTFLRRRTAQTM